MTDEPHGTVVQFPAKRKRKPRRRLSADERALREWLNRPPMPRGDSYYANVTDWQEIVMNALWRRHRVGDSDPLRPYPAHRDANAIVAAAISSGPLNGLIDGDERINRLADAMGDFERDIDGTTWSERRLSLWFAKQNGE